MKADGSKPRGAPLDSKQIEELQASFRKGETLREAAQKANCSPGTVYSWFQRFKRDEARLNPATPTAATTESIAGRPEPGPHRR